MTPFPSIKLPPKSFNLIRFKGKNLAVFARYDFSIYPCLGITRDRKFDLPFIKVYNIRIPKGMVLGHAFMTLGEMKCLPHMLVSKNLDFGELYYRESAGVRYYYTYGDFCVFIDYEEDSSIVTIKDEKLMDKFSEVATV